MREFCDQEKLLMRAHADAQIIGLDESGITCYAGPVSAAAVEPDPQCRYDGMVVDCKLLSSQELKEAFGDVVIKSKAWAVAYASVSETDRLGVQRAAHLAMRRAIRQIIDPTRLTIALVDYTAIPGLHCLQWPLEEGDSIAASISAASIVAKYSRDQLMLKLHEKYPAYRWDTNKGCTTKAHKEAIKEHGLTPLHRKTWAMKALKEHQQEAVEALHQGSAMLIPDTALCTSKSIEEMNAQFIKTL